MSALDPVPTESVANLRSALDDADYTYGEDADACEALKGYDLRLRDLVNVMAEIERLRAERDEAVALLRRGLGTDGTWHADRAALLDRISVEVLP